MILSCVDQRNSVRPLLPSVRLIQPSTVTGEWANTASIWFSKTFARSLAVAPVTQHKQPTINRNFINDFKNMPATQQHGNHANRCAIVPSQRPHVFGPAVTTGDEQGKQPVKLSAWKARHPAKGGLLTRTLSMETGASLDSSAGNPARDERALHGQDRPCYGQTKQTDPTAYTVPRLHHPPFMLAFFLETA